MPIEACPTRRSGSTAAEAAAGAVQRREPRHPQRSRFERCSATLLVALALSVSGCSLFGSGADATGDPLVDVNANDPAVVQAALQLIRNRNEIRAVGPLIDNLDRDETEVRHNSFTTLVKLLTENRFIVYPPDVDPNTLEAKERANYVAYILNTRFGYSWGNPIDPARAAAVARWREWYEEEGRAEVEAYLASGTPPADPSLMDLKRLPLPSERSENGSPTRSSDGSSRSNGG